MEDKLVLQGRHVLSVTLASKLRVVSDIFDTRAAQYNGTSQYYGWRRGVVASGVRRMSKVNARRARLVRGWVTVFGRVYHLGM